VQQLHISNNDFHADNNAMLLSMPSLLYFRYAEGVF